MAPTNGHRRFTRLHHGQQLVRALSLVILATCWVHRAYAYTYGGAVPLPRLNLEGHSVVTPRASEDDPSRPNTIVGLVGQHIHSSLVPLGTPAMLWGMVTREIVNLACDFSLLSPERTVGVHVEEAWGISEELILQGIRCAGSVPRSSNEATFTDNHNRVSVVVCAGGSEGCGVYMTGRDVEKVWSDGHNQQQAGVTAAGLRGGNRNRAGAGNFVCNNDGTVTITGSGARVAKEITTSESTCPAFLGRGRPLAAGLCVPGLLAVHAGLNSLATSTSEQCSIAVPGGSCFPGDASVITASGEHKAMRDLVVGEKVAVWSNLGDRVTYEEIYAFGHKDSNTFSAFVKITIADAKTPMASVSSTRTLELSPLHFVPTLSGDGKHLYKRAKDISKGDVMWAMAPDRFDAAAYGNTSGSSDVGGQLSPYTVTGVSSSVKQGLFNPFTMSGTIVVDGVVASVHSDWFLDTTFDKLGVTHWLPTVYQAVLAPARLLYNFLDKARYAKIYNHLDKSFNFQKM